MNASKYQVVDSKTGRVISEHTDRKRASRKADKLDQAYGAICCFVRIVWASEVSP